MKHEVQLQVLVENLRFLSSKKTVMGKRAIEVDIETYKRLKKEWKNRPYSIKKMMLYDDLFDGE